MLKRINVHFKLLSSKKDVYFKNVWSTTKPDYPFIMGIMIDDVMWYPDGNTMVTTLSELEGAYGKWHYIQDVLKETFKRDKECLMLTFQPIIELQYDDGSSKVLDTTHDWFAFDWHEGYDWCLQERINQLFFMTEQFGEAIGDNVDNLDEWLKAHQLNWTYDEVSMS